jgi:hypothetical protein
VALGLRFISFGETEKVEATLTSAGRLIDEFRKRMPFTVTQVKKGAPAAPKLTPNLTVTRIDPSEIVAAIAAHGSSPILAPADKVDFAMNRDGYKLTLDLSPYTVSGYLYLVPGQDPASLVTRSSEQFLYVGDATILFNGSKVGASGPGDAALVNRAFLKGVTAH